MRTTHIFWPLATQTHNQQKTWEGPGGNALDKIRLFFGAGSMVSTYFLVFFLWEGRKDGSFLHCIMGSVRWAGPKSSFFESCLGSFFDFFVCVFF